MGPHPSKIVDPKKQLTELRPGHYVRLIMTAHGATGLRALHLKGQIVLKGEMCESVIFAATHGKWPRGEAFKTIRLTPGDAFDPQELIDKVWFHVSEAYTVPKAAKNTKRQTPSSANATNRNRTGQ